MGYTWMNGVFTIIKLWKEGKMTEKASIKSLPIWVTMPRFTIHLWSVEVFAGIGSVIGKSIRMDAHTTAGVNREAA